MGGNWAAVLLFQFQSGTIKGPRKGAAQNVASAFQFQSGTIKGLVIVRLLSPNLLYFNSNLVRLKGPRQSCARSNKRDFNSNLVRLKGQSPPASIFSKSYFNSNLVRLKGGVGR